MRGRWLIGSLLALVALLAMTGTAVAGGSATVEMDKPVTRIEAGEEMTLDFMLLQHGVTPTDWTTTYFEATNTDTGETMRVDATPGDETGRWTVQVTFPSAGNWEWAIQTEELYVETTFPALEVVEGTAASNSSGITTAQLDAAITSATEPLEKQISSMAGDVEILQKQVSSLSGERDALQKQISNLSGERDLLQKQIANLEAMQAERSDASGTSWWVAALAGAGAALAVVGLGTFLAMRRGLVRTRELAPATA